MHLKLAKNEDAKKWNNIVKNSSFSTIYDSYEWSLGLELINKNIKSFNYFLYDDSQIIDIFPVCVRNMFFIKYLESLPFSDYGGGSIFKRGDKDLTNRFIQELIKIGKKYDCYRIIIRRCNYNYLLDNINGKNIMVVPSNIKFTISLKDDIINIFNNINKNRRKNLRKALNNKKIIIEEAKNLRDIKEYYKIYYSNMLYNKYKPINFEFIRYLWETFENKILILLAKYNKKNVAGTLRLIHNNNIYAWGQGFLREYAKLRPTDLLNWFTIKWGVENDMDYFDFGGTINDPNSGLYKYKDSWGGKTEILYNYNIILQPLRYKLYHYLNRVI